MAQVTRNAFKGYTYQAYVYLLFIAIMDTSDEIAWMDAEVGKDKKSHDFDDILIRSKDKEYYVQMKNYVTFSENDLEITDSYIEINGNRSVLKKNSKNIIMLHNCNLVPNTKIFNLPAILKDNLYIIPMSSDSICNYVDQIYKRDIKRNCQICHFAFKRIDEEFFLTKKEDLPSYNLFVQKIQEETVIIRKKLDNIQKGLLYIVGKPGVGKSHFVNEFSKDLKNVVIYRFWINSQDDCQNERLQYDNFIRDLGYRIFNDARNFTETQLIRAIENKKIVLIIDGLDHVENYNKTQLDYYFNFIDQLSEIKTIILTRPLQHSIGDNVIYLNNWDAVQTYKYLELCHKITDTEVCQSIFNMTDGYPILVNYSANHYKLYGHLESVDRINDINEYYELLIKDVNTISAIAVFNISNSYLLRDDIRKITNNALLEKIIFEFISSYPYLFEKNFNRFSLIHDSFNTFLRNTKKVDELIYQEYIDNIVLSLSNDELRFMNRINTINIPIEFKKKLLVKYCSFNEFEHLIKNNFDIEAVKEFYEQLYRFLATISPEVLNVYEYYSFILILECCNRINLDWNIPLLYQHLSYIYKTDNRKIAELFSSKILFRICSQVFKYKEDFTGFEIVNDKILYSLLEDNSLNAGNSVIKSFLEVNEKNSLFLNRHNSIYDYERLIIEKIIDNTNELEQVDIISDIIVNLIIYDNEYNGFADCFMRFITDEKNESPIVEFQQILKSYNIRIFFAKSIFQMARFKLFSLGYLRDINPLLEYSLASLISHYSQEGSDEVTTHVEAYIRLANQDERLIDITDIYKCYIMYYREKDYSVISLPTALIAFEKKGIISTVESLRIIQKVLSLSSNELSYLLESYVNEKGVAGFQNLLDCGVLNKEHRLSIFGLKPEIINLLPKQLILQELLDYFKAYSYNKVLEEHYMMYVLESNYGELIKKMVDKFGFRIMNLSTKVPAARKTESYVERGYLVDTDKDYIIKNQISHLVVSEYKDGWFNCFNNLDFYDHYKPEVLRSDFIKIIHISMTSKIKSLHNNTGNLSYYLGNIPTFASMIDYRIDWKKLYSILYDFMVASSIYTVVK